MIISMMLNFGLIIKKLETFIKTLYSYLLSFHQLKGMIFPIHLCLLNIQIILKENEV